MGCRRSPHLSTAPSSLDTGAQAHSAHTLSFLSTRLGWGPTARPFLTSPPSHWGGNRGDVAPKCQGMQGEGRYSKGPGTPPGQRWEEGMR